MDIKDMNADKIKETLKAAGVKLLSYRFYIISVAVLILLSVVILDVSVVTDIEADPSKIDSTQNVNTRQLEHSILEQIEERIDQSSQSANKVPSSDPFDIND